MTRAVVIKTYGDQQIAGAIVEGMAQGARPNEREVEAENRQLRARDGVRREADAKRWKNTQRRLARKYTVMPVGRARGAILGAWACLWLGIVGWYEYLSTWNRG